MLRAWQPAPWGQVSYCIVPQVQQVYRRLDAAKRRSSRSARQDFLLEDGGTLELPDAAAAQVWYMALRCRLPC